MKRLLAVALAVMLLALTLPACSSLPGQSASGGFRLLVSDEPNDIGDFYSVNVTVSQIGVLSADTDNWTTYDVAQTFDLTNLKGDNATAVWDGHIASGNYTKVFIYVDNITAILADNSSGTVQPGDNATVKLPSGKLQISKPFSVNTTAENSTVNFVFDITIIKAGNSGQYILKPQVAESGPDQPFNDVTPDPQKNRPDTQGQVEGKGTGKPETPGNSNGNSGGVPGGAQIPQDLPGNFGGPKR